ncbi:hypothetical protein Tco_0480630 [Tanacetum coccineum]
MSFESQTVWLRCRIPEYRQARTYTSVLDFDESSSVADPPPTGIRAEDIRRLYENIIDLHPVHLAMLYEIGLTTIWKHVGHHPVFKDGEGTVATSMSQFLKFPMARGVRVGKQIGVLAPKESPKLPRTKLTKKKVSFRDDSTRNGSRTHHSASPLNTIIPYNVDPELLAEGSLVLDYLGVRKMMRTVSCRDIMINLATPAVWDQQSRLSDYQALQRSWFELGRGTLAQINPLQWYEALNDDYGELYESHHSCGDLADENKTLRQEHLGCSGKEAALAEKLAMVENEKDDLLDKSMAQEDRIKHLEEALASKTSSMSEAESVAGTLKGDLERLTLDLSHAEIVRHNYVRHLLPTVFQRLLSSNEYKKSLSDVFNQAIAAGWSKGVKVERSIEDAEAILAAATD